MVVLIGYTALHWSAKHGNLPLVRILIEQHKMDPNIRTRGGYAAHHLAGLCKRKDVFDYLASRKDCDIDMRDYSGKRARDYLNSKKLIGDEDRIVANKHEEGEGAPEDDRVRRKVRQKVDRSQTFLRDLMPQATKEIAQNFRKQRTDW